MRTNHARSTFCLVAAAFAVLALAVDGAKAQMVSVTYASRPVTVGVSAGIGSHYGPVVYRPAPVCSVPVYSAPLIVPRCAPTYVAPAYVAPRPVVGLGFAWGRGHRHYYHHYRHWRR